MTANATPARNGRDKGAAALEFVLVFPVMVLLMVGLVNVTSMVSVISGLATAAEFTGDLVARHNSTVRAADLDDYIAGAGIPLAAFAGTSPQIDIYGYSADATANAGKLVWQHGSAASASCSAAPGTVPLAATDPVGNLLGNGSDVVLVRACATFTAPLAQYLPLSGVFSGIVLERQIVISPRESSTLLCPDC